MEATPRQDERVYVVIKFCRKFVFQKTRISIHQNSTMNNLFSGCVDANFHLPFRRKLFDVGQKQNKTKQQLELFPKLNNSDFYLCN